MAFLKTIHKDTFLYHHAIYFFGSLVVAVLNYLYYPVLSRVVSVESFGELQTLISLLTQGMIVLGVFEIMAINMAAQERDVDGTIADLQGLEIGAYGIIGLLLLAAIAANGTLKDILHFSSGAPFIVITLVLFVSIPQIFRRAYLQARGDFVSVSVANIVLAAGKIIFAYVLVAGGLKIFGALFGIVIATLVALFYLYIKTKNNIRLQPGFRHFSWVLFKRELPYGLLVAIATGFLTLLYTSDVVVVKYFFSPTDAGLYSGMATVGRIVFFITGPLPIVLLSSINGNKTRREYNVLLAKTLALTLLIGGTVLAVFYVRPLLIISVLVGTRYASASYLLPLQSTMLFFLSLAMVGIYYFLALRNFWLIPIVFVGLLTTASRIFFVHDSLVHVIEDFLIGGVVTLAALLLLWLYEFTRTKKNLYGSVIEKVEHSGAGAQ
jgi:O-antigen/teichoic acid export membrane protein